MSICFVFRRMLGGVATAAALGSATVVVAAAESAWVKAPYSAVRLIAPAANDGAGLKAGVDLKLDPGWKTYWRYPGEAGLPPRFDFAGSLNVRAVEVSWPAPQRFEAGGTVSIGYGGGVVFPLTVHPLDPARPVVLAAAVSYAVCGTLCIPAEVSLRLPLSPRKPGPTDPVKVATLVGSAAGPDAAALLQRFGARVPRPVAVGAGGPLAIAAVAIDRSTVPWRARVDAHAPADAELFVEGPSADWALPVPAPATVVGDGRVRFLFDLDGMPAGAVLAGAKLTLTLASEGGAIEAVVPLE
ncbi:protein-disulfide reductase DsbD domain-containing protein [Blastochloris viridis]|uniref:Thiol:disulfide interchange protein n=2 Tax=Blastochloris viridis TaxID=1079 RepID=A0A182D034_BLAVI|nr:protein-disulfide reductase DsbD domain-containing protein [Blastochloris viridis]ALK07895.1 hypothetical protein BVIR_78 [Blastochloris viridis]BAR98856.1 thiol:disulfide interchange protein [Blastochloris viridis]